MGLRIALYMRLSKGDPAAGEKSSDVCPVHEGAVRPEHVEGETACAESNSIRMQRRLLREFAAAHFSDYELLEFEDDGYSGINFNRPGVSRLLEAVRDMGLDCIMVKDFSRFSRDYIELGAYLEQIFPFMGVRFISVNDGYDSADQRYAAGELDISFKNLLYDLYSKDLSVKVRSALAVRKEKGQYISASSPFGYVKPVSDRHMLLPAEDEAAVVRRVFDLALQGCSLAAIAGILNKEGVKTPLQFRVEKGETGRIPKKGIFIWQASTVCRILQNRMYVGDLVYGKTEKETVGGRNCLKPKSEWKVYTDHHAPIIDRHTFELLQERRRKAQGRPRQELQTCPPTGSLPEGKPPHPQTGCPPVRKPASHPLTGKLVCGCCGRNLRFRKMARPCFVCQYQYANPPARCVDKADALGLERYVAAEMQAYVLQIAGGENLKARCREIAEKNQEEWKKRKRQLQREEIQLKRQKVKIYEAYATGDNDTEAVLAPTDCCVDGGRLMGKENLFMERLAEMEKKEMTIKVNITEADGKIAYWSRMLDREPGTEDMMNCLGLTELTERNVSELIGRIVVYGGESIPKESVCAADDTVARQAETKRQNIKIGIKIDVNIDIKIEWKEWGDIRQLPPAVTEGV